MSSASLSVSVPEGDSALKEQNMQLLQEIADIKKECARIATVAETAQQTIDTLLRLLAKSRDSSCAHSLSSRSISPLCDFG